MLKTDFKKQNREVFGRLDERKRPTMEKLEELDHGSATLQEKEVANFERNLLTGS